MEEGRCGSVMRVRRERRRVTNPDGGIPTRVAERFERRKVHLWDATHSGFGATDGGGSTDAVGREIRGGPGHA